VYAGPVEPSNLLEEQARRALAVEAAQPELAVERAGCVLAALPGHGEMLALVRRCAARVESPEERDTRFPTDPLLYAHAEQYEDAVLVLLRILDAFPERDWLPWCVPWLERLSDEQLPLSAILQYLAKSMRRFPNVVREREAERAALRRVFPLLDALAPRLANHATFLVFAAALSRKAGDVERATRFADQALAVEETYDTVLIAATCQRFLGNTDRAVAYLRRAAELDPTERAVMARDEALTLEEGGRYAEALKQLERVEAVGDTRLSSFVRFKLGLEIDQVWAPFYETCPRDITATEAYTLAHEAHLGWIVEPTDASLNALKQAAPVAPLEACSSDVEAPSVWLSVRLERGDKLQGVTLLDGADLSLVEPRPGGTALFNYVYARDAGGYLRQQMCSPRSSEPSPTTRRIVEQLASSWYLLPRWCKAAKGLATAVPDSQELVASMAWIGPAPSDISAWQWVQRVQRAAALLLAQRDGGWALLRGVALGTPDWSVAAAVLALTELALDQPQRLRETRGLFMQLMGQGPAALRCVRQVLIDCALRLPDWPIEAQAEWQAHKSAQVEEHEA
jgi:tetratricopeptide (TPR) repeat protein